MKKLSVLFVLIVMACSPAKKESDAVDSTQVAADTSKITLTSDAPDTPPEVTSSEPSEPSTIFPDLLNTPFTDDPREAAVVASLFAMLKQYDSDKYSALSGSYSFGYNEEIGPDET